MTSRAATRLLVFCASLLLLPALTASSALAASAYKSYGKLVFSAAAGERNDVSVSVSGTTFTVTDTGAAVTPIGPGCASAGSNTVTCTNGGSGGSISYLWISAGDGDDAATINSALPALIDGGSGNDRIVGGGGQDWLFGNSGNDSLDGGAGADSISGGDGTDAVDYSGRAIGVAVTLDDHYGDGAAGENDNVRTSVENVLGGSGNDSLTGSGVNNALSGGLGDDSLSGAGGDDSLSGSGGNDTIDGGDGADSIEGGDGADVLRARDGVADQISCGAGTDSIDADPIDVLAADCSEPSTAPAVPAGVTLDQLPSTLRLSRAGTVSVPISCAASAGDTCTGTITLTIASQAAASASASHKKKSKRRVLARKKFEVEAGKTKVLKVRISRNGRRRVLLKRRLKCQASAVVRGADGKSTSATKKVTVKAPKRRSK
jgi:hypothetical protein